MCWFSLMFCDRKSTHKKICKERLYGKLQSGTADCRLVDLGVVFAGFLDVGFDFKYQEARPGMTSFKLSYFLICIFPYHILKGVLDIRFFFFFPPFCNMAFRKCSPCYLKFFNMQRGILSYEQTMI